MIHIILSCFFVITIAYALKMERCKYGTPSSPLYLVLISNFGIIILYILTYKWLGFHSLRWTTVYILLRGIFLFAIISLLYTSFKNTYKLIRKKELKYINETVGYFCKIVSILTIIYMLYRMTQLGLYNIMNNDDIASSFGGIGVGGHVLVLQTFLLAHILGRKFEFKNLPIIVLLFFCLFLYNVKAWIIIPCLIGWFIHRDLYKRKLNPIWLIIIPLIVFAIFTISYFISLGWDYDNMPYIWAHFCKYIYAGIGGLNEAVIQDFPVGKTPFVGFPSFINLLFSIHDKQWYQFDHMVINDLNGEYTNVLSLFGATYYINGPIIGSIYIIIIAVISYVLYNFRIKTNNYWYYLAYYMWASGLILSFFSNYYKLLNTWELTFYAFLAGLLYSISGKRNRNLIKHRNI